MSFFKLMLRFHSLLCHFIASYPKNTHMRYTHGSYFSQEWGTHCFIIPLQGSRHHRLLLVSLSPCLRGTHTKTPPPWERRRTYQGYDCPAQQWLSSQSWCGGAEVAAAACCHRPCWWSDDAAGVPEREREWQGGMGEWEHKSVFSC